MSRYLIQYTYTADTWAHMVHHPQNREEVARHVFEQAGGKLLDFYFSFGENDVVVIVDLPDDVSAAAAVMAVNSSGAFRKTNITQLLTVDEAVAAMEKAKLIASDYTPPTE